MNNLITLDTQNFINLAFVFVSTTLMGRLFVFLGAQGNGNKLSQKEQWSASLLCGVACSSIFLFLMILGYFFPGTGAPSDNFDFVPGITW